MNYYLISEQNVNDMIAELEEYFLILLTKFEVKDSEYEEEEFDHSIITPEKSDKLLDCSENNSSIDF